MNMTSSLTPQQLRQAADLKEKINGLEKQLAGILGATSQVQPKFKTRSAAAKAVTSAKMKAAWAKRKEQVAGKPAQPAAPVKKAKRKMSAAAKARISEAAKARWAKAKAAGKTKL